MPSLPGSIFQFKIPHTEHSIMEERTQVLRSQEPELVSKWCHLSDVKLVQPAKLTPHESRSESCDYPGNTVWTPSGEKRRGS